jgi:hypothetical protein
MSNYRGWAAVGILCLIGAGCSEGVRTGSPAEFCQDYAIAERSLPGFNPKTMADIERFADTWRDIRFPDSLADEAERGLASIDELTTALDGVDFDTEEASDIAEKTVDMEALTAIDDYGQDACE